MIKHVEPEDWTPPPSLSLIDAYALPKRATYIVRPGDVLLSRFKEPLGKCVMYTGLPLKLIVSSNFLLLRSKPHVSPNFVLGTLKSSFLAWQLHRIILRRTLTAELYQYMVPSLWLPKLPGDKQDAIAGYVDRRLQMEVEYRALPLMGKDAWNNKTKRCALERAMSEIDGLIDDTIRKHVTS